MYLFRDLCKATGPKKFPRRVTKDFMVHRVNEHDEPYYEKIIEEVRTQGVRDLK